MNKEVFRSTVESHKPVKARPEALFKSVRAALSFAYSIQHFPIASSPKLMPSVGGSGRLSSMSPQEKHAQGALIRKAAEDRLDGIDVAVTFAFYGTGELRKQAVKEVTAEVAKSIRKTGLGSELCYRYFSTIADRKSQQQLATEYGLSQQMISVLEISVGNAIDALRTATEQKLESMFVQSGIAESV